MSGWGPFGNLLKIIQQSMTERAFLALKQQIVNNDERGLREVFEQGNRYCVRTLLKKTHCSEADAEDIFMDALLIFRENLLSGKLQQLSNLKTYLFGICWNLWRDLQYARKRWNREQNEVEHQLYLSFSEENKGLSNMELDELKKESEMQLGLVKVALEKLGEKCQQILKMAYLEKRKYEEVAQIMGMANANVVKVTKHRCHQKWIKEINKTEQNHV